MLEPRPYKCVATFRQVNAYTLHMLVMKNQCNCNSSWEKDKNDNIITLGIGQCPECGFFMWKKIPNINREIYEATFVSLKGWEHYKQLLRSLNND